VRFGGAAVVLEWAEHGVGDNEIGRLGKSTGGVVREVVTQRFDAVAAVVYDVVVYDVVGHDRVGERKRTAPDASAGAFGCDVSAHCAVGERQIGIGRRPEADAATRR